MKKPHLVAMSVTLFLAPLVAMTGTAQARSTCVGLSTAALAERLAADQCSDGAELPAPVDAMPAAAMPEAPAQQRPVAVAAPAVDDMPGGQNGGGNGGKNDLPVAADAADNHKGNGKGGGNGGGGKKDVAVAAEATDANKDMAKGGGGDDINYALPTKHDNQPKKVTNDAAGDKVNAANTWLGEGHGHDRDHDQGHDSSGHDGKDPSGA